MKITLDNYKLIIPEKDCNLIYSLLIDLSNLNNMLDENNKSYKKLSIDYITEHTVYSSERTDPCPDYYGMYRLVYENNIYENVGLEMNINELDTVICALINFIEYKQYET